MFLRIFKRFFFGIILFLSFQIQAQVIDKGTLTTTSGENAGNDTIRKLTEGTDWLPTTSLYIELGGKVFYSLNADFRKKKNFALSIGASYLKEEENNSHKYAQSMFFPSVMGYYLGGKRHRLELGGGLCAGIGSYQGLAAMALYGGAGYRYQKKKGLIFRIGFTPFITIPVSEDDNFGVVPWAGISLGYSF